MADDDFESLRGEFRASLIQLDVAIDRLVTCLQHIETRARAPRPDAPRIQTPAPRDEPRTRFLE